MKISISALSIAYGLTPEALRYYEEKGLLSPDRTASSGFRRFSIADVQRLGIIKSLQRQGFSLDEIKRIITHCPLAELVAMMDEKRAALREQIAQQNAVYERMTCGTDLLRDCDRLSMQPRLCAGSAGYLIDFDSVSALWASVPKLPILKALIDAPPADQLLHDHPASSADRRKRRRAWASSLRLNLCTSFTRIFRRCA
ncbi:MAG: MerR family transcriptional regulator [Christensenellales bacterium]